MYNQFYQKLVDQEQSLHKYFNTSVKVDGITFDSKKEANRYGELKLLEKGKQVRNIQTHPKFLLQDKFKDRDGKRQQPIYYFADFQYEEKQIIKDQSHWVTIVEDVKGYKTEIYKLKKKMFLFKYPEYIFRET